MSSVAVELAGGRSSFRPGEAISGAAQWRFAAAPKRIEVRLFWYTEGKGTQDVEVVDRFAFDDPAAEGAQGFRFLLPEGPYSCSGKLISLLWAIEVVAEPEGAVARQEITVSPTGNEIQLGASGEAAR